MTEYDQLVTTIALTLGVGWASGINLYAAVLTLGALHHMGHMTLPPGLEIVAAPVVIAAAAMVGGTLAAGSHALKAGGRMVINTSPEPVSNWTASMAEDAVVIGGLWVALNHPALFLLALAVFVVLLVWLLPKIWRGVRRVVHALGRWLGNDRPAVAPSALGESPALPRPDRER